MKTVNIHTHRPRPDEATITTAGIHPYNAEEGFSVEDLAAMMQGADAVGEIGLDYACAVGRDEQQRLFEAHLRIAEQAHLPVVLHCVRAFEPVMRTIARYRLRAVIFHGFIGSAEQMRRAVSAGYYLSFGERTFASPKTVEALRQMPPERLFTETDESLVPIEEINRRVATILGIGTEQLERVIRENYETIFKNEYNE